MKKTVYYMHTLDGKPASFEKYQICFAACYGRPNKLCGSLAQIRKEQRKSVKWRKKQGYEDTWKQGYFRFALPGQAQRGNKG